MGATWSREGSHQEGLTEESESPSARGSHDIEGRQRWGTSQGGEVAVLRGEGGVSPRPVRKAMPRRLRRWRPRCHGGISSTRKTSTVTAAAPSPSRTTQLPGWRATPSSGSRDARGLKGSVSALPESTWVGCVSRSRTHGEDLAAGWTARGATHARSRHATRLRHGHARLLCLLPPPSRPLRVQPRASPRPPVQKARHTVCLGDTTLASTPGPGTGNRQDGSTVAEELPRVTRLTNVRTGVSNRPGIEGGPLDARFSISRLEQSQEKRDKSVAAVGPGM